MKNILILFALAVVLSSCTNTRIKQLEAENNRLIIMADSLQAELEKARIIAAELELIAQQEAIRARVAEDSAMAIRMRLIELKKKERKPD